MPWTENEKGYAANITYLDREVGKIMAKIRELGLEENTLVIFSSDNGADAPDRFERTADAPLKGKKRDMYEGGIRVPFIAYWKGTIAAGRTSTHVSAFWDFLPTVCELAGVKPKQSTDGISYLPEFLGKRQKKHESFYFEFYEQEGKQGYIEGDWKLVHLDVLKTTQNPVVELYNIRTDPEEKTNIVTAQPKRVEEMQKRMQKSRISNPSYRFND
jgi:arylsulfatase A-like enzyme